MKIKEAEKLTGIPSANIRFYEKEGLLMPDRNMQNNYREYDAYTIERLNQIKIFRALGIPLDDIKMIFQNEKSVESVIYDRLKMVSQEETHLKEIRTACERILRDGAKLELLDDSVLEGSRDVWKKRLEEVFTSEMTAVDLSVRQMNRHMTILLAAGFLLQMIIAILFHKFLLEDLMSGGMSTMILWGAVFLLVFASIATYWSGSIKVHAAIFILVSVLWPSLLQMVIHMLTNSAYHDLCQTLIRGIPVVQFYLAIYTLCIWKLSEKNTEWIKKEWHTMLASVFSSAILGLLLKVSTGNGLPVTVMAFIGSVYVGIYWTSIVKDIHVYNRYYAVASVNRLLNPVAVIFHYRGRQVATLWR